MRSTDSVEVYNNTSICFQGRCLASQRDHLAHDSDSLVRELLKIASIYARRCFSRHCDYVYLNSVVRRELKQGGQIG